MLEKDKEYQMKTKPISKVTEVIPDVLNDEGEVIRSSVVKYINHVGAQCVMLAKDFEDMYEEKT